MNFNERIARATQIADELNRDSLLCQEVKFLLTDLTARSLTSESPAPHTVQGYSSGHARIARPQFDLQPRY